MQFLLKNAEVFHSGSFSKTDVLIENGKIKKIGNNLNAEKTVDLEGKHLIPGVIDAHVHFRYPGWEHKETWHNGSKAAAKGGVTTVLDMPNTNPPTTTCVLLEEKRKYVSTHSLVNYGFHFGATSDNFDEIRNASNIPAVKIFMSKSTGTLLVTDSGVIKKIFNVLKEKRIPAILHAPGAETARAVSIANEVGNKAHLTHMSTKEEIEIAKRAKEANPNITFDTAVHYLFLNDKDVERLGNFGKVMPPIGSQADTDALWREINEGTIDCIITDHAPHTIEEKEKSFEEAPPGLPGVETMVPLLLDAVNKGKVKFEKLVPLITENSARIFGLQGKGKIQEGFDADLTVIDMEMQREINNENVISKCGWSPYAGMKLKGWPVQTYVLGNLVYNYNGDSDVFLEGRGQEVMVKC